MGVYPCVPVYIYMAGDLLFLCYIVVTEFPLMKL